MDFEGARKWMVDGQLRPNKVTDPRILNSMSDLPRHLFVPPTMMARAHADEDVPLGHGRVMLQPMMLARLLQLAKVRAGEAVLVLAAGTAYGAALVSRMGGRVTAIEAEADLLALGREALSGLSLTPGTLDYLQGSPAAGYAEKAPYDLIVIEGAVQSIPKEVVGQLAEGGRLVTIRLLPGRSGVAVLGQRLGGGFSITEAFDCNTVLLPGFAPEPGFVL